MKLSKIVILFCAVLFLLPASVIAQADFFQKGESGIGLLAGYAEGNSSNTIQGAAFVIYSGILDFGIYNSSISQGRSWRRTSTTSYHLGIYPLRENASRSIRINLGIFAEYSNIQGINHEIVGISMFKRMGGSSSFSQPKVSVIKVWPRGFNQPGEMAYQLDFTLGWRQRNSIFTATASVLKGEDATILGFTAGFAIVLESGN